MVCVCCYRLGFPTIKECLRWALLHSKALAGHLLRTFLRTFSCLRNVLLSEIAPAICDVPPARADKTREPKVSFGNNFLGVVSSTFLVDNIFRSFVKERDSFSGKKRHISINFLVWLALGRPRACPRDKPGLSLGQTHFIPGTNLGLLRNLQPGFVTGTNPGSEGGRKS